MKAKLPDKSKVRFYLLSAWSFLAAASFAGCAAVKPYEREKLSDPIMNASSHVGKQSLEQKFYSTQEGSAGGGSGIGGGCGCAK